MNREEAYENKSQSLGFLKELITEKNSPALREDEIEFGIIPKKEPEVSFVDYTPFGAKLTDQQIDMLTNIARKIMRSRRKQKNSRRITANSVLRALLNVFNQKAALLSIDDVHNESQLEDKIRSVLN